MNRRGHGPTADDYERRLARKQREPLVLTLYVAGMTPRSTNALQTVKAVCDDHAPGGYQLEVVDLYHHPYRARKDEIVVAPTLVRHSPLPVVRLVGNLGDRQRLVRDLSLAPAGDG